MTAASAVQLRTPRVNDKRVDPKTGARRRFRSVILPPWCRKSPKVAEVLRLLYVHGLSTGHFVPALEGLLGSAGLSAASIARLTKQWTGADGVRIAQAHQLTLDPAMAPRGILRRQPQDELAYLTPSRRPAGSTVWIGPTPGHELAVPTQQRCPAGGGGRLPAPIREHRP
jgi:hypothetical protein